MNSSRHSAAPSNPSGGTERRRFLIHGIVQGVGFRPFIYRLAVRRGLAGFVRNHAGGVLVEAQGLTQSLDRFLTAIEREAPAGARIDDIECETIPINSGDDFRILSSLEAVAGTVSVSPDLKTCPRCLAELQDRTARRYRYPFLNCTECGPRLTIIQDAPYDRCRTTMASFSLCSLCRAEYDDPQDRRFHAEPIACAACGPNLSLLNWEGATVVCDDPLVDFAIAIRSGWIGAIKGVGGFHLVCDARNRDAVSTLRERKQRDERPLAIMVANVSEARKYCFVSPSEQELLESAAGPIVVLDRKPAAEMPPAEELCCAISAGQITLGIMLPYSPLHTLLMDAVRFPLVMTSGNRTDQPIAYRKDDAVSRLSGIADVFLTHNRPISIRCDDSVVRVIADAPVLLRRSRGYVPTSLILPFHFDRQVLAVGGQQKGTFALGMKNHAVVSHHLGDLDDYAAYRAFEQDEQAYERIFRFSPERIVCDLHPDYASTVYAERRATENGIELLKVQHHHAHIASCMAENGLVEPIIGVAFDGTGFGESGPVLGDGEYMAGPTAVWGGEFLLANYEKFNRAARLRYVAMPGSQAAIREPWRMAIAHMQDAGLNPGQLKAFPLTGREQTINHMIDQRLNSPATSSVGRLFDAIASMIGIRHRVSYEGQAAGDLESMANGVDADFCYPFGFLAVTCIPSLQIEETSIIDTRPIIRAIFEEVNRDTPPPLIARRFHSTLAEVVVQTCHRIRDRTGMNNVAFSGGVFVNRLLTENAIHHLDRDRFRVFRHRLVPPNDGGLSLGQLAIAATVGCH